MLKKILKVSTVALCVMFTLFAGVDLYKLRMIKNSDCVVRISFTGIENMFHDRYEYYAVDESRSVKIPEKYVPDNILNSSVSTMVDDSVSDYWFVQLMDVDEDYQYMGDGHEKSTLGEGLYLTWSYWTNDTHPPEEKDLEVFRKTAELFYDENQNDWIWEDGKGNRGLISFMLIKNNGNYIVIDEDNDFLYRIDKNGKFVKIMSCPEDGDYNYFWFMQKSAPKRGTVKS